MRTLLHSSLLLALTLFSCVGPASAQSSSRRFRVVWSDDPATAATIGWEQPNGEAAVLCYDTVDHGEQVEGYAHRAEVDRREEYLDMDSRFVHLTGLEPDTSYFFVVTDGEGVSRRLWFRTAPAEPEAFTFVAGGDTKSYGDARAVGRVGNRIVAKLRPLFVLYAGDFVSGSKNLAAEWQWWLDDWNADTIGEDGRIVPIVPVRGNHEPTPDVLYRIFGLPAPENYFAFSIAGELLRLYALNSEINVVPGIDVKRGDLSEAMLAQNRWLERDLADHSDVRFTLTSYHKPIRPHHSGKPENDYLMPWATIFERRGVAVAVEGDSHMHAITWPIRPAKTDEAGMGFVRDDEKGTMYVGEGSWGAVKRANDDDKPWTMVSASIQQFKWVHVHPERIDIRTVEYDLETDLEAIATVDDGAPLEVPKGLPLFRTEGVGPVISYPVSK